MNDEPPSKRLLPRLGCFGWGLVIAAPPLLFAVVALLIWSNGVSHEVQAKLAQIRAAGEPVTADELANAHLLPPNTPDGTRFWLTAIEPLDGEAFAAACANLPLVGSGGDEIPPPGEPWPQFDDARQLLEQYAASLRGLHAAADDQGGVRFPLSFNDGIAMLVPHA